MQLPLFTPETSWRPPALASLPDWSGAKRIAYDTETKDPTLTTLGIGVRRGGHIIGVSFAIEDGPKHYLPIRHEGGDNLDEGAVLRYLRHQAANFTGELVGAKLEYDLDYSSEEGIEFKQVKFFRDVQVADPLINELHDRYGLDPIAERYGMPGKDEGMLIEAGLAYCSKEERKKKGHIKQFLHRFPGRYVGAYAEQDVALPLALIRRQERIIEEKDLWKIYDLESRVLPVLVRMRRRGILIDQDHLAQVED
jgi:DNA polymerase I-like protein with 3'-5' exonuclease and polymerase domains